MPRGGFLAARVVEGIHALSCRRTSDGGGGPNGGGKAACLLGVGMASCSLLIQYTPYARWTCIEGEESKLGRVRRQRGSEVRMIFPLGSCLPATHHLTSIEPREQALIAEHTDMD